jgi:NADH dehydrogenase
MSDAEHRRRALTFVFVGGGYTGVEALAELQDMASEVLVGYPELRPADLRWVLVEAQDRILNTVPASLAEHALRELRKRGIDVRLGTRLDSAADGVVTLSDGTVLATDTLVWVTGTKPNRVITDAGLPADDKGRIPVDEFLRAEGATGIWSAGDCAAVPDVRTGRLCPPTAQYAVREANALGDNLVATVRGASPRPFRYRNRGEFVTLGRHKAVGEMLGVKVKDLPAWAARRLYYLSQIPTWNRRLRISADWLIGLPFRHDVVNLGSREQPRAAFQDAARSD